MTSNSHKYGYVVDEFGIYIDVVIIYASTDGEEIIESYKLKSGESIVNIRPPHEFVRAKWNGSKWIETATREEIEAAKPSAQPVTISESDRISALEEAILTLALGGTLDV